MLPEDGELERELLPVVRGVDHVGPHAEAVGGARLALDGGGRLHGVLAPADDDHLHGPVRVPEVEGEVLQRVLAAPHVGEGPADVVLVQQDPVVAQDGQSGLPHRVEDVRLEVARDPVRLDQEQGVLALQQAFQLIPLTFACLSQRD
ncbi:hypothetical protein GCM10020254_03000 [Streptomyces goshikiensis]